MASTWVHDRAFRFCSLVETLATISTTNKGTVSLPPPLDCLVPRHERQRTQNEVALIPHIIKFPQQPLRCKVQQARAACRAVATGPTDSGQNFPFCSPATAGYNFTVLPGKEPIGRLRRPFNVCRRGQPGNMPSYPSLNDPSTTLHEVLARRSNTHDSHPSAIRLSAILCAWMALPLVDQQ